MCKKAHQKTDKQIYAELDRHRRSFHIRFYPSIWCAPVRTVIIFVDKVSLTRRFYLKIKGIFVYALCKKMLKCE